MTKDNKRSQLETMRHIETVRNLLNSCISEILSRQEKHDQSKLSENEAPIFEEYTEKLKNTTYGSDKYKQYLKEMKPALEHHYKHNRHHPEHFLMGIKDMNLIDILEMLVDWKASSLRHDDGCLRDSIVINQSRFGYSDEFATMLLKTAEYFKWL